MTLDTYKLIDCMKARAALWNRQSPLYTARAWKKQLWREVVAQTGATEDEVRRKWKCLNDIFRREYNKYALRKKEDPDAEPPQWIYYNHMVFLESHIGMRSYSHNSKRDTTDPLVAMLSEEPDDNSLDSALAFEDVNNFADVSIKLEVLDGNSLSNDVDCIAGVDGGIDNCSNNENVQKEKNTVINAADVEPAAKRTKQFVNEQRNGNTNQRQNETNLNQQNNVAHNEEAESAPSTSNGPNANSTITQRLLALEQRQFEDNKSNMLHQHRQQQQHHSYNAIDDDYHFALSLVPTMRGLPLRRKMLLRLKIQQLLCEQVSSTLKDVTHRTNESEDLEPKN